MFAHKPQASAVYAFARLRYACGVPHPRSRLPQPFINARLLPGAADPDALIMHPHIQRTGGGAFRKRVLVPVLGSDRIYGRPFLRQVKPWKALSDGDLVPYRAYMDFSDYRDIGLTRPVLPVALLRHPLYRAVSLYHYVKRKDDHPHHGLANALELFPFYVRASRDNPNYYRNLQSRRICGHADSHRAVDMIGEKYLAVGFTGEFGAFVSALCAACGWPALEMPGRAPDEARYAAEITPEFRDIVLRENAEDLALYEIMAAGPPHAYRPRNTGQTIAKTLAQSRYVVLGLSRRLRRIAGR